MKFRLTVNSKEYRRGNYTSPIRFEASLYVSDADPEEDFENWIATATYRWRWAARYFSKFWARHEARKYKRRKEDPQVLLTYDFEI